MSKITDYQIREIDGRVAASHVRVERDDGSKAFAWKVNGEYGLQGRTVSSLPLYGAHEARTWPLGSRVFVCEGEKATEAAWDLGLQAVGTVTGAGVCPDEAVLEVLRDVTPVLWPDNDAKGVSHMDRISLRLETLGIKHEWVHWPKAPQKGDAADYFRLGGTAQGAYSLVKSTPVHRTVKSSAPPDTRGGAEGPADNSHLPQTLTPGPVGINRAVAPAQPAQNTGHQTQGLAPGLVEIAITAAPAPAAQWQSVNDLEAQAGPVAWRWRGFLAEGCLTLLGGREKVGKSTLISGLIAAIVRGLPFLGMPTAPSPVLYVTEEGPHTLAEKLRAFGADGPDVHLLLRHGLGGERPSTNAVAEAVTAKAAQTGARVAIVDTLAFWSGLRAEDENSAGAMSTALWPLQGLAQQGMAVLIVHHHNKSGGFRGSTAIPGAVDIMLDLTLPDGREGERKIEAVSRFADTPGNVTATLYTAEERHRFVPLGAQRGQQDRLMDILQSHGPATREAIAGHMGISMTTVTRLLSTAVATGVAHTTGRGVRDDPVRYIAGQSAQPGLLEAA